MSEDFRRVKYIKIWEKGVKARINEIIQGRYWIHHHVVAEVKRPEKLINIESLGIEVQEKSNVDPVNVDLIRFVDETGELKPGDEVEVILTIRRIRTDEEVNRDNKSRI